MSEVLIVAGISFLGTCAGAAAGILTANRLMNYRIEQLEKKVEKHNNFVERLVLLEQKANFNTQRIVELEKKFE